MTTLADKIRAGRRAALASLNARVSDAANVVSIYEDRFPVRRAVPEFHTVRTVTPAVTPAAARQPVLVLTDRLAA